MLHELTSSKASCFVTLTYDDQHLMRSSSLITHAGTLSRHHLQTFIKRLRRLIAKEAGTSTEKKKIKYYACGEYGDETLRPHYHKILFGVDTSWLRPRINDLWHHGTRNDVSVVTEARVRYVAGYIDKKLFGEKSERAYRDVEPPFQLFSQSLGLDFAIQNYQQILYDGLLSVGKIGYKIPAGYMKHIGDRFPAEVEGLKDRLLNNAKMYGLDWLLEKFPQFGGLSYEQLDESQRHEVNAWLRQDKQKYYADLIAGIKLKKLKQTEKI